MKAAGRRYSLTGEIYSLTSEPEKAHKKTMALYSARAHSARPVQRPAADVVQAERPEIKRTEETKNDNVRESNKSKRKL